MFSVLLVLVVIAAHTMPMCAAQDCSRHPMMFQCPNNGKCILSSFRCDGDDDCGDNSDETDCKTVRRDHFRCSNGRVVPARFRCDGDNDCNDNSDEVGCGNITRPSINRFHCSNGNTIIPSRLRCDGDGDCPDNSDEAKCPNATRVPQFRCSNGRFVRSTYRCDIDDDCDDQSDERDCDERRLALFRFRCSNGLVVPSRLRCDGNNDCQDGTDEAGCRPVQHTFQCNNRRTISFRYRCDGDNDCGDNSDETGCTAASCPDTQFFCNLKDTSVLELSGGSVVRRWKTSPRRIERTRLCDGIADCSDGGDEVNCTNCDGSNFECDNKRCLLLDVVCDGKDDCGDSSDERQCHASLHQSNGTFQYATIVLGCALIVAVLVAVVSLVKYRNAKRSLLNRYTVLNNSSTMIGEQGRHLYIEAGVHYRHLNQPTSGE